MDKAVLGRVAKRIIDIRSSMLLRYPFFGRIVMRLPMMFSEDGTAATDMKRIIFNVNFAEQLNDEQIMFVLLHEVMHCVLKHCIRGGDRLPTAYNVACDIVVNSLLLDCMGLDEMEIAGQNAMHLTPDNREGRLFTAEEVYDMITKQSLDDLSKLLESKTLDSHERWDDSLGNSLLGELWDYYVSDAASKCAGNTPLGLKRYIDRHKRKAKIDWRQVLHDFIQFSNCDYSFAPPDRRFQDDFIMPAFSDTAAGATVEKIWFCVDTSGSVGDEALEETVGEIRNAIEQIDNISGYISYFDGEISKPHPFNSLHSFDEVEPIGGGGTDFFQIFRSIPDFFGDEPPKCIIIMTDGYAHFPPESDSLGIPVLWIIVDSSVQAPFGTCIHIDI